MKIKSLLFCAIASVMCLCNANAATKKCPAGLFCTSGGNYVPANGGIQSYMLGPADLATANWGDWSEEGFCSSCKKSRSGCVYCADDYDEAWVSTWFGYYLVSNGNVAYHSSGNSPANGAFPCPGTYPSSAEGATSVFECYKVINGQKEYYKAPVSTQTSNSGSCDIASLQALVENLQVSLNKVSQDLQNALDKAGQNKAITASANIGSLSKATGKAVQTGKGMRSGSTRSSNVDVDAAKTAISAGI